MTDRFSDRYYSGEGNWSFPVASSEQTREVRNAHTRRLNEQRGVPTDPHAARNQVLRNPWLAAELVKWSGDTMATGRLEQARLSNRDIRMGLSVNAAKTRIGLTEELKQEIYDKQVIEHVSDPSIPGFKQRGVPSSSDGPRWEKHGELWVFCSYKMVFGDLYRIYHITYSPNTGKRRVVVHATHSRPSELRLETARPEEAVYRKKYWTSVNKAIYTLDLDLDVYIEKMYAVPIPKTEPLDPYLVTTIPRHDDDDNEE